MTLSVDELRFFYGNQKVLHEVSFWASERSCVSILGPNGAGKTTLLKCLCKVLEPRGGVVSLDGRSLLDLNGRELAKSVAYVPQTTPVARMNVFDAVLLGRRPHLGAAVTPYDLAVVADAIESLGLEPLAMRRLGDISGGEFQKVQIARALAQGPRILLLDEPCNNLDIANQHRAMGIVRELVERSALTAIMTMHDVNVAAQYSDRFLFMAAGNVLAYGGAEIITRELLYETYGIAFEVLEHRGRPLALPLAEAGRGGEPAETGSIPGSIPSAVPGSVPGSVPSGRP